MFEYYNNPRSKGSLGQLIEKHFFFYDINSKSEADFNEAGVELKVTPYTIKANGDLRAKERLVLTIINYMKDDEEEDFFLNDMSNSYYRNTELSILLTMPNVVITSHQAFFTKEALDKIGKVSMDNIKEFFETGSCENFVQ